jgi:excisionase family DNA binding protein
MSSIVGKGQVAPAPKIYTVGAVAKLTGVTDRTVAMWFNKGFISGFRIPGTQHRRVYEDVLVKFLLENEMRVPEQMLSRYRASMPKGV